MTNPTQPLRKARPILFSGAMIRALLDGRKTQTRRVIKPQPVVTSPDVERDLPSAWAAGFIGVRCPYGVPGDVLWARETWGVGTRPCPSRGWVDGVEYRADCTGDEAPPLYDIIPDHIEADGMGGRWRPSIHMPRWASRLTLQITDIRVERLQDISEADAQAEGVGEYVCPGPHRGPGATYFTADPTAGEDMPISRTTPIAAYKALWEHINGCGSWDANPWVWVMTFTVHHQNVDTFLKTHEAAQ